MSKVKLLKVKNKNDSSKNTLTTFQKNEEDVSITQTKMIQQIEKVEKDEKDWYLYELYSLEDHKKDYHNREVYHWHNVSEEILCEAGFIHDFNKLRLKRKEYFENGSFYHPLKDFNSEEYCDIYEYFFSKK